MAIEKLDVTTWLDKCRLKALSSIDSDINQYLSDLANKAPTIKEDYQILGDVEYKIKTLQDRYKGVNGLYFDKIICCFSDYYGRSKIVGINALVYSHIIHNKEQYSEYYNHLKYLFEKKKKVDKEYESLISIVIKKRNVESMIKYLNELGFDTSSLMTLPQNINKDLLFVCHDNKP